jgi:hypothetical protein
VVSESSYAKAIIDKASDMSCDLVLIPWNEMGAISEGDGSHVLPDNHFQDRFANGQQMSFMRIVLDSANTNTVILIDRGFGSVHVQGLRSLRRTVSVLSIHHEVTVSPVTDLRRHIFFPFFGVVDDRVALSLVLQLAHSTNITASIIQVMTTDE